MTKGRKSIPSKIIDLRGGSKHTHRKPRDPEPEPPERMSRCPAFLNDVARKEWKRIGKLLHSVGLMSDLERPHLTAYCQAWSEWLAAIGELQKPTSKSVYKKTDGTPALNPYIRVAKEAEERWSKAAAILGIGTSNRVGLKAEKPKGKSKAERFMARKGAK